VIEHELAAMVVAACGERVSGVLGGLEHVRWREEGLEMVVVESKEDFI
jgi:hypothetical protein